MDVPALRATLLGPEAAAGAWAAVAVVLSEGRPGPSVLLIRRAAREDDPWSGQIACPGGRVTPRDPAPFDACVRETQEEVGLDLVRSGELVGVLPPRPPANRPDLVVAPFVWRLQRQEHVRAGPEVVAVWYEPLGGLPALDREVEVPVRGRTVRTRGFVAGGVVIWGFTYRILIDILDRLGLDRPRDPP